MVPRALTRQAEEERKATTEGVASDRIRAPKAPVLGLCFMPPPTGWKSNIAVGAAAGRGRARPPQGKHQEMIMDRQNNPEAASEARARAPLAREEMLGGAPVQAGRAGLEQMIERRIVARTWRQIRQLRVELCAERVVVHGQTPRYYAKQLAILAVQEALREAGVTAVADVRITVSAPLGRRRTPV